MNTDFNPDLPAIDPNLLDNNSSAPGLTVPPRNTEFKGFTPEQPTVHIGQNYYYYCPTPAASMHREDGKRMSFLFNIFKTDIKADIQYMERQIESGSQYVRRAKPEEIRAFEMKMDPKGTMKREVIAEVEADVRARLEKQIREEYEAKFAGIVAAGSQADTDRAAADTRKIGGIDAESLKQRLNIGGATLIMDSKGSGLNAQNSDQIKSAAAGSGV